MFVASGPDDPNAPQEDKSKEAEPEVEKTPEKPQVSRRDMPRLLYKVVVTDPSNESYRAVLSCGSVTLYKVVPVEYAEEILKCDH